MPLLIKDTDSVEGNYGLISSLSVQLKPSIEENKSHIIPSGLESDPSLKVQAADSLANALRITAQYTKHKQKYWEIYIDFENKQGEYTGSSFGMLLVLKLVEEILRFYDSSTKIFSKSSAALSGQVDTGGNIPSLSEDIIRKKTRVVFFSDSPLFIVPEDDLPAAKDEIRKLSIRYPHRNLRVIGIPLIDDLFNLRNVVEIKKESRVLRAAKFVRKQSAAIILLILLAVVIFFSGLLDFDTNPAKLLLKGSFLYVMNKNEKVLWKKFLFYDESFGGVGLLRISAKLFDIDADGTREVIVANEADTAKSNYGAFIPRITCYDNSGNAVWTCEFKDTISTRTKKFLPHYEPSLINIINRDGRNILYCFARQYQYYPGVIFSIDVKTGKRIGNTFWHSGRFADAHLGDFNRDGKPEIVAVGAQNSYEGNFILSINLDELDGCGPATT